jgi:hypothetical protein
VLAFLYNYPTEGAFLKTLYECLKPIKTENIELNTILKHKKKKKKKKVSDASQRVMPTTTLNVTPEFYRIANGGGDYVLHLRATSSDSSWVREMSADFTYDNTHYFPANLANPTNGSFWSFVIPLERALVNNQFVPSYTMTMTNIAPNKIRLNMKLLSNSVHIEKIKGNLSPFSFLLSLQLKPLYHNLSCLSPFGTVSQVNGTFDMKPTTVQPSASGNYTINLLSTDYRLNSVIAPCSAPTVVFTPTTIRAGTDEYLYIRPANADGTTNGFGWTKGKVWFRDANAAHDSNNNPLYVTDLDASDLTDMDRTDTLIKVKVPSLYLNIVSGKGCAGSGKIVVQLPTQLPSAAWPSTTKLHIEYAALNYDVNGVKKRSLYVNSDCKKQNTH